MNGVIRRQMNSVIRRQNHLHRASIWFCFADAFLFFYGDFSY
jgi:hypothetical protein